MAETEVLASTEGGVCTLTLNRPEAMNAITTGMAEALRKALADGAEGADVIVIRGAGGNFCAGGDFKHVQEIRSDPEARPARRSESCPSR
jgi:enoyl-CoA hydratase/carnithine racemase